ncbi:tetratricopeptide repeat protein [Burkholderia lata]|uniref:Sel1 repeat protein n=1 Tax=Burkholderia lata (strain ATCC 17760 / DSM 23089 / LMG 22485 / NCIMB 9086 / R18194 / 383) TaxID=482957 RepID=A0A6P2Y8Y1_BURL3|nr:SEL1-like repeat protein [Burkholderia lata]VWD18571.1 Sel1 repeat protein [Burkholderia lata]
MKKTLLALCIALAVAPAFADLQGGLAAYKKDDYQTAIPELTTAANAGNAEAAALLGEYYRYPGRDDEQAVKWSFIAAQHGDVKMQYDMAVRIDDIAWRLFRYEEDPAKRYFRVAADCFQLAADRGYAPAQSALGLMYDMGLKLPADLGKATALYRSAARQGDPLGLESMGTLYQQGRGVKENQLTAYTFYLAALKSSKGSRKVEFSEVSAAELEGVLSARDREKAKATVDAWEPGQPLDGM